jgi:hypothetical protein
MARFRISARIASIVVFLSLFHLTVSDVPTQAVAAQPRAAAAARPLTLAQVMQVQHRYSDSLMNVSGVMGTATGWDRNGKPVVKVFVEHGSVRGIPSTLDGVPVQTEITGVFEALAAPQQPTFIWPHPQRDRPPTVEITYPDTLSDVSTPITIKAEAYDDNGVAQVQFFLDKNTTAFATDADGSDGWTADLSVPADSPLTIGWHSILATATDTAGQTRSTMIFVWVLGNDLTPIAARPSPIGVSTGHPWITAGTIGCRVADANGDVYALSNNHIYAAFNDASIGDNVLQPGPYDGGVDSRDAIGTLANFVPINFSWRGTNTVDAAIALTSTDKLGTATPTDDTGAQLGYGIPSATTAAATVGMNVQKYGRTTGLTTGTVSAINANVFVSYGYAGYARFTGQIVVGTQDFTAAGDSGSLVVAQDGKNSPVGLVFAGNGANTICNPIDTVLSALSVTVDDTP